MSMDIFLLNVMPTKALIWDSIQVHQNGMIII